MSLVNLKEILQKAYEGSYAVGAFNAIDSNFVKAVIEAAEEKQSPVILNIAEVHYDYCAPEQMVPMFRSMAENATVPVAINLDHGISSKGIKRALNNGFTSVMFDGSKLDFEENLKQTREVVEMAEAYGVYVEAELGAVGGEEGGGLIGSVNRDLMTNPEQAKQFVKETGISALAVAIGNSHGKYKGDPELDFELLEQLSNATEIPLVLHGGSGISTQDFRKAISLGIAKINFYTGMSQAALESIQKNITGIGESYNDYPIIVDGVKDAVKETVKEQMDIFCSTNKAKDYTICEPLKRSTINRAYRNAKAFFKKNNCTWHTSAPWDITDVGFGDFNKVGATLINLAEEPEYCEKLLYSFKGQEIPYHCHKKKKEDIICRVGAIELVFYPQHPDECSFEKKLTVQINGQPTVQRAGVPVVLIAGDRVTIGQGVYHKIKALTDECIMAEVSTANDDAGDNYFANTDMVRFGTIDEDEPAEIQLTNE